MDIATWIRRCYIFKWDKCLKSWLHWEIIVLLRQLRVRFKSDFCRLHLRVVRQFSFKWQHFSIILHWVLLGLIYIALKRHFFNVLRANSEVRLRYWRLSVLEVLFEGFNFGLLNLFQDCTPVEIPTLERIMVKYLLWTHSRLFCVCLCLIWRDLVRETLHIQRSWRRSTSQF